MAKGKHGKAICGDCGKEMIEGAGCTISTLENVFGEKHRRVRYGHIDGWDASVPCHDCNVTRGQYHHFGCDVERCPICNGQLISCDCWD